MSAPTEADTPPQRLKLWQQNLDQSLDNQHELMQTMGRDTYQIAALQEPYIGPGNKTRANDHWRVVYPTQHGEEGKRTRAVTLVNASLPTEAWSQLHVPSPDVVAIELRGEFGTLRVVNIYNDGDNNDTLAVLRDFMRAQTPGRGRTFYVWLGDFNRHSPMWDEFRNAHLFTAAAEEAVFPLLQLLGQYRMEMPLPKDVPTLRAKVTGNLTHPDNVFCSREFLEYFISCNAYPARTPGKTDHFPIIMELDLTPPRRVVEERLNWGATDWEAFGKMLEEELLGIGEVDGYAGVEEVEAAIEALDAALWRCAAKHVTVSKVSPHSKRWWTGELSEQKKAKEKLARKSYRQRDIPDAPIHEEFRRARNDFSAAIKKAREGCWLEWMEDVDDGDVFVIGKIVQSGGSDGGRTRVPDLRRMVGGREEVATTNQRKSEWMMEEFYPVRAPGATDPPEDTIYPEPLYEYESLTEAQLYQVIEKMKPWKATRSKTFPNCVYKFNAAMLVPRLQKIYKALDVYQHEPADWKRTETIVGRKPGKPDYSAVGAHRPLILSHGHARLRNGGKNLQLSTNAEYYKMLPNNHWGGRPGRTGVDMIQGLVKRVKDAWRGNKVATLLLRDVKGAFPSAMLSRVVHNMRMAGVPREHAEWMMRRFAGRTTRLVFDDYVSDPLDIDDGLDQGDPQSVNLYLFFNSPLARLDEGHADIHSGIYIDDYHLLAIGRTLRETTRAVEDFVVKEDGVNHWATTHNSAFGAAKDQVCHFSQRKKQVQNVFTRRLKWVKEERPRLVLNGVTVRPLRAVKLVGVWLDENLTFKEQAAAALGKGHQWLVQFRRIARVSGGVGPAYVRRLYLAICVPRMMYGAEVWLAPTRQRERGANRKADKRAAVKKLASIQLKATRLIMGGMVSSPGDLLNAHADVPPIHLAINRLLQKAALRYATLPKTHPLYTQVANVARYGHVKKHPSPLHYLMTAYKDVRQGRVEVIRPVRRRAGWVALVEVRVADSKEEAEERALAEPSGVQLFSDGSLIEGKVGAAGLLMVDGVVKRQKGVRLGSAKRYGVYEAEGVGMILALECLRDEMDVEIRGSIPLGLDNTSALYATANAKTGVGRYIWDFFHKTLRETKAIHPDFSLRLVWTPGHVDIPGNEAADEAAKRAALEGSFGETTVSARLPYSKSALALTHARLLKETAKKEFKRSPRHQQIKEVDDSLPSASFRKLIAILPRKHASLLFQLRSHHAPLARHLHRLKKAPSPDCPCCEEADETVAHYLYFCPAHNAARRAMYAASPNNRYPKHLLNEPDHLPALFAYVQRTRRFHSVFGDFQPVELPPEEQ